MLILRNGDRIRRQRSRARWTTAAGVALLVGALLASNLLSNFSPEWLVGSLLLSYIALIGGFIFFSAGLQGLARWSRRPRADERIDNHLRRLSDRFHIFHYPTLGGKSYEHVVVHPGGVMVLVTRDSFGPVSYRGGRWRKEAPAWKRLLNWAGPTVGNPTAEAATAAEELQAYLHSQGITIEVDSAIVFVNPLVRLTVEESAIPVRRVEDLASLLTERSTAGGLIGSQRLELIRLLSAGIGRPEAASAVAQPTRRRQRGAPRYRPATRIPPAAASPEAGGKARGGRGTGADPGG